MVYNFTIDLNLLPWLEKFVTIKLIQNKAVSLVELIEVEKIRGFVVIEHLVGLKILINNLVDKRYSIDLLERVQTLLLPILRDGHKDGMLIQLFMIDQKVGPDVVLKSLPNVKFLSVFLALSACNKFLYLLDVFRF